MPVRPALPADLDAVAAIYAHYVHTSVVTFDVEAPTVAAWRDRLAASRAAGLPFLVDERPEDPGSPGGPGTVAGFAYVTGWRTRAAYRYTVEDSVYVAPWALRRGVGAVLLGDLLDRCTAAGLREVIAVIADAGDPGSVALHRRFGFADAGRLRGVGVKGGRFLDTVLMQRSLP